LTGLLSGCPAGTLVHTPSEAATLQAEHVPAHAELQQYPSTQFPRMHWASSVQVWPLPLVFLQTPMPSQTLLPVQVATGLLSVLPLATLVHVPGVARLHDWHAPQLADPQHTPSTHWLFTHWLLPIGQAWPTFFLQPPAVPSQELFPEHVCGPVVSVWFAPVVPQTPSRPPPFFAAEHAWQSAPHAVLQQTPSTQDPLTHSFPPPQACPSVFLH
jgi:hypothetical protein